jgi:flagellar motor component MotA
MVFDYEVFERARCGEKERRSLESLVDLFCALSEKARREGLLALEEDIGEKGLDPFLALGLKLVLDGATPEVLEETLVTSIFASGLRGKALLARMVAYSGIRSISQGYSPECTRRLLEAYLGFETGAEAQA